MSKPNFGEIQLQSCFNQAIFSYYQKQGQYLNPVIPTLAQEASVFYDTAFAIDDFPYPKIDDQEGCNLFIQYKLSQSISKKTNPLYGHWGKTFFRFQFPHSKLDEATGILDYHQFNGLRELADKGCAVFYFTNDVVTREALFHDTASGILLERAPILDVSEITQRHKFATFAFDSDHFCLHSDPIKVRRINFKKVDHILREKRNDLGEDNKILFSVLREVGGTSGFADMFIDRYHELQDGPAKNRRVKKFLLLRAAFRTLLGIDIVRFV